MTVFYGTQATKVLSSTVSTPSPGFAHGTVRCFTEQVNCATVNGGSAVTTSDTVVVGLIPKGSVFLYGILTVSVTMGSSTIAIGITGTTGKYRAAATATAITPEVFGVAVVGGATGIGVAETADRTVFLTIAAASLPTVGIITVQLFYAHN